MRIRIAFKAEAAMADLPFTGTSGLYSSMRPDADSINEIVSIAKLIGIVPEIEDLHTTVMYSPTVPENVEGIATIKADKIGAFVSGITTWVGHNDKTYIVLQLMSEGLIKLNAEFATHGCEATFLPYVPHVTLSSQKETLSDEMKADIERVNKQLAAELNKLTFINLHVGDLDG